MSLAVIRAFSKHFALGLRGPRAEDLIGPPMPPKFNRLSAVFVVGKTDEILAWEHRKETERDTKFVELEKYLL